MEKVKKAIAYSSAATLGYISGGSKGAIKAVKLLPKVTQKESRMAPVSKKRKREGPSYKRIGWTRNVLRRKKQKKRYTKKSRKDTKKIKNIVKRQLECDFNKGVFERNILMNYPTKSVIAGQQDIITYGLVDSPTGYGSLTNNLRLTGLCPYKFIDAASVLYNGKSSTLGPGSAVGNFDPDKTSVNVIYSSQKLTITNLSDYTYDVHMLEAKARQNNDDANMVIAWSDAIANTQWKGGITPTQIYQGMFPTQLSRWGEKWSVVQQKKFQMKPGDKRSFFQKWSGCVDFVKYANGTAVSRTNRGFSQYMFVYTPIVTNNHKPGATYENAVNRITGDESDQVFAIEINEVYKIQQPDETLDANEGNFRAIHNHHPVTQGSLTAVKTVFQGMPNINKFEGTL